MTNVKAMTKKQKDAFVSTYNVDTFLQQLPAALERDLAQLGKRNSKEINETMATAIVSDNGRLTEVGQQILAFMRATVSGLEWEKTRFQIKKNEDVIRTSDLDFSTWKVKADKAAAKAAEDKKKKAAAEAAEAKAKAEAAKIEAAAKAAEAKAKAESTEATEADKAAAKKAEFEHMQVIAAEVAPKRVSVKAAEKTLLGLIAGNLQIKTLQEANNILKLLSSAQLSVALQAQAMNTPEVEPAAQAQLDKVKPSAASKSAPKKKA